MTDCVVKEEITAWLTLFFIFFVKICLEFDKSSENAGVTVFQGKASHFPVVLHLCQEARASRFPAPFPGLTPPTSLHLAFLVLKSMVQQILGIPLKPLSGNVGGARAIAESHGEMAAFQEALLQAQEPQDGVSSWQPGFGLPSLQAVTGRAF